MSSSGGGLFGGGGGGSSTGAFSFGAAAPATPAKTDGAPAFSFGGSSSSTSTSGSTSTSDGAGPAKSPKPSSFSFGGGADSSNKAASGSASSALAPADNSKAQASKEQSAAAADAGAAKLHLNGLTVEQIVTKWNLTLQQHVASFESAAEQVKRRDALLLENQKRVTELAKEAQMLRSSYTELRTDLDSVCELQVDLHSSLEQLERELDHLEAAHPQWFDGQAERQRQQAYDKAEQLTRQMDVMANQMRDAVTKINRQQEAAATGGAEQQPGFESVVMEVLNKHYLSLEWLDKTTQLLSTDVALASRQVSRLQASAQARAASLYHR